MEYLHIIMEGMLKESTDKNIYVYVYTPTHTYKMESLVLHLKPTQYC